MTTPPAIPLACVPAAIPAAARSAHFELLKRLFGAEARERREHPDGYAFRFDADAWSDVARWIDNERHCCPFLRFDIELQPADGEIWVRLRGPEGVHAFLDAEMPFSTTGPIS
jgi:hypothetical protein